jgi:hypothetical protein
MRKSNVKFLRCKMRCIIASKNTRKENSNISSPPKQGFLISGGQHYFHLPLNRRLDLSSLYFPSKSPSGYLYSLGPLGGSILHQAYLPGMLTEVLDSGKL